jgi:hypothetical protein
VHDDIPGWTMQTIRSSWPLVEGTADPWGICHSHLCPSQILQITPEIDKGKGKRVDSSPKVSSAILELFFDSSSQLPYLGMEVVVVKVKMTGGSAGPWRSVLLKLAPVSGLTMQEY